MTQLGILDLVWMCGHLLWSVVLIKCLIPPIVSSPISPFTWIASNSSSIGLPTEFNKHQHSSKLVLPKTLASSASITVPSLGSLPLAFDFAYPITYSSSDSRQVFSIHTGLTR